MTDANRSDHTATAADWEIHPMPAMQTNITLDLSYSEANMARIRHGFIPTNMDEKWFLYFADDCLHMHRSWTGLCIFQVYFSRAGEEWRATHAVANRDREQYGETSDEVDRDLIADLIHGYLVTDDYHCKEDGFMAALELATQPNYLGSPEVVRNALTPLFATVVGAWVHLHNQSAPKVTFQDSSDAAKLATRILSGEDPEYTPFPGWHSVKELGQSAIRCFQLDANYCADESLYFILTESLAAVSIAIKKLLRAYFEDLNANWQDAIVQLNQMLEFVTSVMLGTHSVTHPGKTLGDFHWKPVIRENEDSPATPQEPESTKRNLPTNPGLHPCRDEKGRPVQIKHPSQPTGQKTWSDMYAVATFVPGGDCPDEINDIPLEPWIDHPEGDDWLYVEGQVDDLDEPTMHLPIGKEAASGVIVEEPDGRVWIVSPTNRFGGYKNTFPKGKADDEINWQANAIKEAFEESGLQVRIIDLIGDVTRSTTVTRYYRAVRVGGMPTNMGWESQAVHLVPSEHLRTLLNSPYDQTLLKLWRGLSL
jgi:hypothetical protein